MLSNRAAPAACSPRCWSSRRLSSAVEHEPALVVAQALVVEHERPDRAAKLRPLPLALGSTSRSRRARRPPPRLARLLLLEVVQHVLRADRGPLRQKVVIGTREAAAATNRDEPRVRHVAKNQCFPPVAGEESPVTSAPGVKMTSVHDIVVPLCPY